MGGPYQNRALMISLALAASGILTCGLALADTFLPRGSTIVVLVTIPLLGAFALAVLILFAWICELLDRRGYLGVARQTTCKLNKPGQAINPHGSNRPGLDQGQSSPKTALPTRPLIDYPVNLGGKMSFQGSRWVSGRHGQ